MTSNVVITVAASWLVSVVLAFRAFRQPMSVADKLMIILVLLMPVIGPLAYLWIWNFPDENDENEKNDLSHGEYTQREISRKQGGAVWDRQAPRKPDKEPK